MEAEQGLCKFLYWRREDRARFFHIFENACKFLHLHLEVPQRPSEVFAISSKGDIKTERGFCQMFCKFSQLCLAVRRRPGKVFPISSKDVMKTERCFCTFWQFVQIFAIAPRGSADAEPGFFQLSPRVAGDRSMVLHIFANFDKF